MRIALAHSRPNTFGGGERAFLELARGLAPRHQVRLLVGRFRPECTYPELTTLPYTQLATLQWPFWRCFDDVVVTNSFGANLLALRNGSRVVYWVHSIRSQFLLPGARRPDLLLRRALDWLAVRRVARLVANSQFTATRLRSLYRREADAVIYPGVDLELFRPVPKRSNDIYAVTVGRLSAEKGLNRLFDLWRNIPDMPLHVVGGGHPDLVRHLRVLAPPQVIFRGPLAPEMVAAEYQQATVAVFTPYGEEFGIAPLEAMACGIPVVAWREGGVLETVIDGETGFLVSDAVSFNQRVRLLQNDPDLRHTLGQAARRQAEYFSWDQTVAQVEQVCAEVSGIVLS